MSNEIETIGLGMDTSGVEKGIKALDVLAGKGAPVEKAMGQIEGAAAKTGKTLASLGQGSGAGLKKVGDEAGKAGGQLADMGAKAKSAGDQLGQVGKQGTTAASGVGQAGKAANQSAAEFTKMSSAATGAGSSLAAAAGAAAGLFAGLSIAGTVGKVVAVQREFDILNSSLKTVSGSSAAAEREMTWLKQFAKDTPFGLAQATRSFVQMKALGLDPTRASLTSFGNTASAMGKNLNQMVEAVADASTGEFERLKEFGIKAKVEGDKVSLTFQGVTKTIENSAKNITKYLEDIGNNQFGGAMAERAKTLDGVIAGLGDTWDELFRTISSNGAGTIIYDTVTAAAGAVEDATTILRAFNAVTDSAAEKSSAFGAVQEGLAKTFETVAVMAAQLSYVLSGVGREIGGWAAQLNALEIGPAELANPAAAAGKALAALAKGRGEVVAQISRDMKADAEAARRDIDALTERILGARKAQEELAKYKTRNDGAANDPRRTDASKPADTAAADEAKAAEQLAEARRKLYGVDKDYLPTLEMLHKQFTGGKLTLTEYQGLVGKLAEGNYKASSSSKAAASAAKEELNTFQSLVAAVQAKIRANAEEAAYSGRLTESDKLRIQLQVQLEAGTKKLTAAHRAHAEALLVKLGAQEKDIAATKRAVAAYQDLLVIQEEQNAAYVAESKARESGRQSVTDYVAGIDQSNEALEYEISLLGKSEGERQTLIEQYRIELDLKKRIAEVNKNQGFNQPQRDEEIARLTAGADRAKAGVATRALYDDIDKAAKKSRDELDRYIEDTKRGLGDAIETAIFDGSKAGGEKMREVLQEALLRKPLRMLIDGVLNQVTGGALQLLGIGGGGGAAGGGNNLMGMASNAYSLYNGASSAYTLGSQYLGGTMSGANALGSVYANAMGTGIDGLLATNAAFGTSAQSAIAANLAMEAGTAPALAAGTNAAGAAGASGIGSFAAGGIAAAIMLAVINILGGMRSETMIGSGLAGTLGGDKALTPWQEWREGGTLLSGPEFATHNPLEELSSKRAELQRLRDSGQGQTNYAVGIQAVVTDLEKTTKGLAEQTEVFNREIGKGYKAYRSNVMDMADSLGLAGDSIKDFAYELGAQDLNLQGLNPEQVQAKIAETFGKAGTEMAQQLLGSFKEVTDTVVNTYVTEQMSQASDGAFVTDTTVTKRMEYQASVYAKTGETAIDTLTRLATSFNTLNEASDALGFGIQKGSLALADFSDKFIEAFGGLEKFTASTGAFLQNYYTDTERRDYLIRSGVRQAEKLGIQGLTEDSLRNGTREQLRDFVNTAATNPELYADAMDLANYLSPIFASYDEQAPVVQELSNVVDELTQAYQNAVKSLKGDADSLAVELLRAQGNEVGAKAQEKANYLSQFEGLDAIRLKEIETLYDTNAATRAHITELERLRDLSRDLAAELPGVLDMFRSPQERVSAGYDRVAEDFRAEGFAGVTGDALAALTKDQLAGVITAVYNLGSTSDETRLMLIRAASSLSALKDQAIDLASSRTDAAYAALEREAGLRRKVLDESIADVRAVFDAVSEAARSLYGDVSSTSQMMAGQGRSFIENALSNAQLTGYLPDSKELQEAISASTSGISKQVYTTQFDADRDRLVLAGQLSALGDISGEQLSEQEKQLEALDGLLDAQRDLIDATRGVDTRVLGVDARIALLTEAILAERGVRGSAPASSAGQSSGGVFYGNDGAYYDSRTDVGFQAGTGLPWMGETIRDIAKDLIDSGNAKAIYDALDAEGYPLAAADAMLGMAPGSAEQWAKDMGLPIFHDGTNFVPRTGFALLERGERITPAAYNPFNGGEAPAMGGAEVLAELRALRSEVAALRSAGSRTADASEQMADQIDTISGGGRAFLTETA